MLELRSPCAERKEDPHADDRSLLLKIDVYVYRKEPPKLRHPVVKMSLILTLRVLFSSHLF